MQQDYLDAFRLAAKEAIRQRDDMQTKSPVYRVSADDMRLAFGGSVPERDRLPRKLLLIS